MPQIPRRLDEQPLVRCRAHPPRLGRRAPDPVSLIAYRNVLKLDAAQAARLYQRLHDFWQEYEAIAKAPAADGRFYAFTVALYPNDVAPAELPAKASPRRRKERLA